MVGRRLRRHDGGRDDNSDPDVVHVLIPPEILAQLPKYTERRVFEKAAVQPKPEVQLLQRQLTAKSGHSVSPLTVNDVVLV